MMWETSRDPNDAFAKAKAGIPEKRVPITEKTLWREEPVTFEQFVKAPEFCGSEEPSETAYYEVQRLIGSDPKKVFSSRRLINEAIWLVGKGGGKGFVASLLFVYLLYLVLCMTDAHAYFGLARADPIDFITVALSAKQSEKLFKRISNRILDCMWFRKNYNIVVSGKLMGKHRDVSKETIVMSSGLAGAEIAFPGNIRAQAVHSQNEAWEGLTILVAILDEFSGFTSEKGQHNAESIYNTVSTSTRELPYVLLITSYQRLDDENDATVKKYKQALKEGSKAVGCRYYSWQFKPARFYCGDTFPVVMDFKTGETIQVPVEYEKFFKQNPEDSKAKYMCRGAEREGRFLELAEMVNEAKLVSPLISTEDIPIDKPGSPGEYYLTKRLSIDSSRRISSVQYAIAIDGGETYSDAALGVGHAETHPTEGGTLYIVVVDGFVVWRPDPEQHLYVDLENVVDVAAQLAEFLGDVKIRMDHWNSALMERSFLGRGISAERVNVSLVAYNKAKTKLYSGCMWLPDQDESQMFGSQFKALGSPKTGKPRVLYGKQDVADVGSQLCDMLFEEIPGDAVGVVGVNIGSVEGRRNLIALQQSQLVERAFSLRSGARDTMVGPMRGGSDEGPAIGVSVYGSGPGRLGRRKENL